VASPPWNGQDGLSQDHIINGSATPPPAREEISEYDESEREHEGGGVAGSSKHAVSLEETNDEFFFDDWPTDAKYQAAFNESMKKVEKAAKVLPIPKETVPKKTTPKVPSTSGDLMFDLHPSAMYTYVAPTYRPPPYKASDVATPTARAEDPMEVVEEAGGDDPMEGVVASQPTEVLVRTSNAKRKAPEMLTPETVGADGTDTERQHDGE
jgi:hypothetical protein